MRLPWLFRKKQCTWHIPAGPPSARARPRSQPPLGRSNGGVTKHINRLVNLNPVVASMIGTSNEGLSVAGNGGKGAARSEASFVDEVNGYELMGELSEREEGNGQVWNDNPAYSEEDRMVLEVGEEDCALMAVGQAQLLEEDDLLGDEDDLLPEGVSEQGEGHGVGGKYGEQPIRIDLADPLSFLPLNGGRGRALLSSAGGINKVRPSLMHSEATVGAQ